MRTIRTPITRERFLAELRKRGIMVDAIAAAGISRTAAYDWRKDDAEFAAEWDEAVETANDRLIAEAWRRGVEGYRGRPVTHQGEIVTELTEYSDTMLDRLLKARIPAFRERLQAELTGAGGGPVQVTVVKYSDAEQD